MGETKTDTVQFEMNRADVADMVAKLETIQLMIEGSARITTAAGINMWI